MFDNLFYLLNTIDHNLTVMLNFDGGVFLDSTMFALSSRLIWIVPALALLFHFFRNKHTRKKGIVVVIAIVVLITLCDQTTSTLMKPYFARLRPSHTPGIENILHYVNGYRGGMYGFASSHAANSFGTVTFVSMLIRRKWVTFALLALALGVCYSRIYLGVHFLGDVLTGAVIGVFFGYIIYRLVAADWTSIWRWTTNWKIKWRWATN